MTARLAGKVALVSGAARGMGASHAREMVAHGARVVISSRKAPACEEVAAAINEACDEGPGATVAVDGQEFTQVKSGARVRLRVSDVRFPLVVPDADVYKRLRGSLGWGYR